MKELSTEARALLDGVREAHAPGDRDRDRVREALARRLAAPAAAAASATGRAAFAPSKVLAAKVTAAKALAGLVVAGSVAATVYSGARTQSSRASQPSRVAVRVDETRGRPATSSEVSQRSLPLAITSSNEPSTAAAANEGVIPHVTTRVHVPPPVRPHAPAIAPIVEVAAHEDSAATTSSTNTLGEELALVRAAQDALRNHDAEGALALLDRHAARFASGVLREERSAARVLALCALNRVDEARAEATTLLREAPSSPHAARVRSSCAGESN